MSKRGAEEGQLGMIFHKFSFVLHPGKYHWLKNDVPLIDNRPIASWSALNFHGNSVET